MPGASSRQGAKGEESPEGTERQRARSTRRPTAGNAQIPKNADREIPN